MYLCKMWKWCLLFFFSSILVAKSQDTVFFDFQWKKIATLNGARYFEVSSKDSIDPQKVVVRKYVRPKMLLEVRPYADSTKTTYDGIYLNFYPGTGQPHSHIPYKKGLIDGELITWWGNGELKRKDIYENGKFISGKLWNTNGKELPYYSYILNPSFKKGEQKYQEFLKKNLHYPADALQKGVSGTVEIGFNINDKGVASDFKIVKSVDPSLDAEALRLVSIMPRWKPRYVDGMEESSYFVLPITFSVK